MFAIIATVGLYATVIRFGMGLGASTNLSDRFPWGLWIGFDDLAGVALAAGGFTVAAGVYILGLHHYRPILRATILTAFLGYLMAGTSLIYDVGRPLRIWHPIIMWNEHSPMFLVAVCVMVYTAILAIEFSPAIFEWLELEHVGRFIHMLTPPLTIVGVLVATLHQSALGALFVIAPGKLHPLWYTPLLPALFYVSAIGVGMSMVIVESSLCRRCFGVKRHDNILSGLAKAIVVILTAYLTLRILSLALQRSIGFAFQGSIESLMFWVEILLGIATPLILFTSAKIRNNSHTRSYAALFVIIGVVLNRLNVSIIGISRYAGFSYIPSFIEIATTVFIVTLGIGAFCLIVRHFPILPEFGVDGSYMPLHNKVDGQHRRPVLFVAIAAFAMLTVALIAYGYRIHPPLHKGNGVSFDSNRLKITGNGGTAALRLPADYTFPKNSLSPGKVVFSHTRHVQLGSQACTNCHPDLYPMSRPTKKIGKFHGTARMHGCAACHDGKSAFSVDRDCAGCHVK